MAIQSSKAPMSFTESSRLKPLSSVRKVLPKPDGAAHVGLDDGDAQLVHDSSCCAPGSRPWPGPRGRRGCDQHRALAGEALGRRLSRPEMVRPSKLFQRTICCSPKVGVSTPGAASARPLLTLARHGRATRPGWDPGALLSENSNSASPGGTRSPRRCHRGPSLRAPPCPGRHRTTEAHRGRRH